MLETSPTYPETKSVYLPIKWQLKHKLSSFVSTVFTPFQAAEWSMPTPKSSPIIICAVLLILLIFPINDVSAEMKVEEFLDDKALYDVIYKNAGNLNGINAEINYIKRWIKNKRTGTLRFILKKSGGFKGEDTFFTPEQTLLIYERALELMTE